MKSFAPVILSAILFATSALGQTASFQLNTPSGVVECQPILLNWSGSGTPPYILSVLPANQPSAQPLEQYTGLTGSSFTWNANIQGGTQVGLTLRDSTGASSSTAPFPVNSGGDSSCLSASSGSPVTSTTSGGTAPSTPGSSGASTTPASTSSSATTPVSTPSTSAPVTTGVSTPATTGASTPATTSKPATTSGSSTPAPSTTGSGGSTSGAAGKVASVGAAALAGAFVAVILA